MPPCRRVLAAFLAASACLLLTGPPVSPARAEAPDHPGGKPPRVHALTHARIVPAPGQMIEDGTLVIRDGLITAVGGPATPIPPDARVWDMRGRTVYAGLIEPYLRLDPKKKPEEKREGDPGQPPPPPAPAPAGGAVHEIPRVHPERSMAGELKLEPDLLKELREAGFTAALLVPREGIFRGASALVNLRDGTANEQVVRADIAQHLALEHADWGDDTYPGSLMGSIAAIRQTFLDAQHYEAAMTAYARNPGGSERPEANRALESLLPVLAGKQPVAIEAEDINMRFRAERLAREFNLKAWIVSGGSDEYRRIPEVKAGGWPLVLAVNFPEPPAWQDDDEALNVELETLRQWELGPSNPARLHEAGVGFSITSQGLKQRADWRERVRSAIERGLPADAALAALTVEPAALLGASAQLGALAPGKIANLTVADGDLFAEKTAVLEVWVDGARYEPAPKLAREGEAAGTWDLELVRDGGTRAAVRVKIEHRRGELAAKLFEGAPSDTTSTPLARPTVWRGRLELVLPARLAGLAGEATIELTGTIAHDRLEDATWSSGVGPGAARHEARGRKQADEEKEGEKPAAPPPLIAASAEPFPPLPEPAPPAVLVRNATLWTCGPAGTLEGADLLVRGGKIEAVGRGLSAPPGTAVIDGAGKHVTPGLIDCHSHSAIAGGVNEGTHSCTAEVRIGDVIDPESIEIYRQLAGGVAASHQLHGSANVIGGQNAVIKHRWGAAADGLRFAAAPPGIKFALGENVKQSNWGERYTTRYPQTRMGVEQWTKDRFLAARDYMRKWDEWRRDKKGAPPRRDLQLEALAEVLRGERLVHCHSYRQDEILMLIRLADELGFKITTFQHILEGYKVANEMAIHGAGGSSFSDWWAYKFEVYDAIPFNGAIMHDRGVVTSFNSDSSELARRLNSEAAKAVKYGGVPEVEALKFVTLNPARQLGVAGRAGTLEPGKDGDFAIWDHPPLSNFARCEQTWIEGRRYFERGRDLAARAAAEDQRQKLLERARVARAERERHGHGSGKWQPTFGALYGAGEMVEQGVCEAFGHGGHDGEVN